MPRENSFENKRVVIIGGSSGIGLAVAEEAASQGADVVVVSSKAERVQEAIQSIGGNVRGEAVDVSDEKAVESFSRTLAPLITWFSPQVTACNCTSLLTRILSRPGTPLSCGIGLRSPRSSTEAHISARAALSSSPLELPADALTRDGQWRQVSAEQSKP
jgi:D-arabinose 1-dehydrogenase-like Zn-dependent alcohol dehydrogenase